MSNFSVEALLASALFLFLAGAVKGFTTTLHVLGRIASEELIKRRRFPRKNGWEITLFSLSIARQFLWISFTIFLVLAFPQTILWIILLEALLCAIVVDMGFSLLSSWRPHFFYQVFYPFATLTTLLVWPLAVPFHKFIKMGAQARIRDKNVRLRDKILDFLQESELCNYLDANDQKLLLSIVSFKERIVREIMVPRIDVFCLSADTTLQEAAQSFLKEGFSRIPVYRENVDNIVGVLLYKDVLNIYASSSFELEKPIAEIIKPVLYTPETKKISHLLQEFRSKQIHLAIVVDEYGGTEGIITIEDILEELVGEIADEFDVGEVQLFTALPGGGWIVDAKMGIIDVEEELGIKIPSSPEYDTIGGYIFQRAGAIPEKGWKIHHDAFDLEILSSDDRSIDKIRIIPNTPRNLNLS